jgi:hypothetical protein
MHGAAALRDSRRRLFQSRRWNCEVAMVNVKMEEIGAGPTYLAKELTNANKRAAVTTVDYWHSNFLPMHFQAGAATRYAYQARAGQNEPAMVYSERKRGRKVTRGGETRYLVANKKYYWDKKRRGHGTTPLVYTGTSMKAAESVVKLSSTGSRGGTITGTAAMPALPRYFYQSLRKPGAIDKAAELTAFTPDEELELVKVWNEKLVADLNAPKG